MKWKNADHGAQDLYDGDMPVGWVSQRGDVWIWVIHTTPGGSFTKKGWEWTRREAKAQALEAYGE
jgi:hypothetical protein